MNRHDTLKQKTARSILTYYITYVHATCWCWTIRCYGNPVSEVPTHPYKTSLYIYSCFFVAYLTMLPVARTISVEWWNYQWAINRERCVRKWSWSGGVGTKWMEPSKSHQIQNTQSPERDLNPGSPSTMEKCSPLDRDVSFVRR
jgi:hypothetical protein